MLKKEVDNSKIIEPFNFDRNKEFEESSEPSSQEINFNEVMILEEDLGQKPDKMCINLPKKVEKFRPYKLKQPSKKSSTDSLASATQFYQGLSCSLSH